CARKGNSSGAWFAYW
nr:immunoglobulin heavy chain junction region [Mus musculus]